MQKKIALICFGILSTTPRMVSMESGGELHEEDPTIVLMKKTWEQRGKITQLRRMKAGLLKNDASCAAYQKLEELDRKLDSIAKITSEAQYFQYLAQKATAIGNTTLEEVKKEIAEVEAEREEKAFPPQPELPKAKL